MLKHITTFFKKQDVAQAIPTEQELNVVRVFASGNAGLRDSAIRIGRQYVHLDIPEILFMREIDTVSPDLALRSKYREQILKTGNA